MCYENIFRLINTIWREYNFMVSPAKVSGAEEFGVKQDKRRSLLHLVVVMESVAICQYEQM